ncbi:MAG: winged helix-turn-helix domain-containing protein [Burkholderiaceae bacterium]|nr:winged helix-turn-helix domain-containing protein [Burkholderiaceae bacterium]
MRGEARQIEPSPAPALRIGPWRVDRLLNQISQDAETIRLEPRAIELLVYLAERPGQVVSREELFAAVWPGVVVTDDALTHAVIKLRKALGDTARQPVFIETISKRGYRLIAPVASVAEPQSDLDAATAVPAPPLKQAWTVRRASGIVGLTVALAATGVVLVNVGRGTDGPATDVVPALQRDVLQLANRPTILVRPFEIVGGDPLQRALAAGLTADLGTDLAKISGLTVLASAGAVSERDARSTAFAARYVVSGSVQRDADRLRINVRLTDDMVGEQLWSERFDRAYGDLFAVQDDVVTRILAALPVKIGEAERARVARRYTRSLEAYELFHRGLLASGARGREQNETARALYWRAIGIDPAFARAYAGVAMTHLQEYRQHWAVDGRAALGKALEMAEAARRIDPESAEVLWVLAFVRMNRHEHAEGFRLLQDAVKLNPSYADAYFLMGWIQTERGRPAEGLALMRSALRLMPNPGYLHYYGLGLTYFFLGEFEQARTNLQEALLRNPSHAEVHAYMAAALLGAGQRGEAAWHAEEIRALRPGFGARTWLETQSIADSGQRRRLRDSLEQLGF